MKKINAFKYIFIVVIIILAIVTYRFYSKEKKEKQNNVGTQEVQETENVVKELRLAISGLDTINPIISHNKHVQEISKIIFDPLITLKEDYSKEYALASEVSKIDDKTYIIRLKDNIKWSDGTEVTSADVRYTVELLKNIDSIYSENVRQVGFIDILDNKTLRFTLTEASPFFEYNLTFPIMSSEYYKDSDFVKSNKTNLPLGTGLFKIVSFDEKVINLERNTQYWNTEKHTVLEKININIYATMGEVYNDFKNGNVDTINTSQRSVSQYIGSIGFEALEFDGREYDYVAFNAKSKNLSSAKVRKALTYYIDKNNTVASCYGNSNRVSDFPLDYGSFLYQGDVIDNSYNAENANNLLHEEGWTYKNNIWQKSTNRRYNKLYFTLTINEDNPTNEKIAQNLIKQWNNSGVTVSLKKVNTKKFNELLKSKKGYDAILLNISNSYSPNINTFLGNGNFSNYSNKEVNQLLSEVNNITDDNLLKEKYKRIMQIYNDEKPFLSISRKKNLLVYNANLTGSLKPTVYNIYNNIEKWYRRNY